MIVIMISELILPYTSMTSELNDVKYSVIKCIKSSSIVGLKGYKLSNYNILFEKIKSFWGEISIVPARRLN